MKRVSSLNAPQHTQKVKLLNNLHETNKIMITRLLRCPHYRLLKYQTAHTITKKITIPSTIIPKKITKPCKLQITQTIRFFLTYSNKIRQLRCYHSPVYKETWLLLTLNTASSLQDLGTELLLASDERLSRKHTDDAIHFC